MSDLGEIVEQQIADITFKASRLLPLEKSKIEKEAEVYGYREACKAFYKALYTRQIYNDFVETGAVPYMPKDENRKKLIEKAHDAVSSKPPYMMLTINIRPNETMDKLRKSVEKFVNRKIVAKYFYVYEIRKAPDRGLHCHMLVQYNCKPYEFKRCAKSTFKKVCDSNNPSVLNFKFVQEDLLPSKIGYLLGDKQDKKKPGVKATIEYRKLNNLEDYYESNPQFPCRVAETNLLEEEEARSGRSPHDAFAI